MSKIWIYIVASASVFLLTIAVSSFVFNNEATQPAPVAIKEPISNTENLVVEQDLLATDEGSSSASVIPDKPVEFNSTFAEPVVWQDGGTKYSLISVASKGDDLVLSLSITPARTGLVPLNLGLKVDDGVDVLLANQSISGGGGFSGEAGKTYFQDVSFSVPPDLTKLNFTTGGSSSQDIIISVSDEGIVTSQIESTVPASVSFTPPVKPSKRPPVTVVEKKLVPPPPTESKPALPPPTPPSCPRGGNCIVFQDPTPTPVPPEKPILPAPLISSLSPSFGYIGTTVIVTGTGFQPTGNKIKFGNLDIGSYPAYNLNSADGKMVTFTVPTILASTDSGTYWISILNANGASNETSFTLVPSSNYTAGHSPPTPPPVPPAPEFYLWSDASTWGGTLPQDNDDVIIPVGKKVIVDINPPKLSTVRVDGSLIFKDDHNVDFKAGWIMVSGLMELGTEANPFTHKAVITLMNGAPNAPPHVMTRPDGSKMVVGIGTKGIMVVGDGRLELHGVPRVTSWTRIAETALKGATTIKLEKATDWKVGERIVIASTDYEPLQAEDRTITSVNGNVLTLDKPLLYMHWGQPETFDDKTINESAEVGLLTRNVLIQGDDESLTNGFGGHIMTTGMGISHIENVELVRMGQKRVLGRYPIHFHMQGDMGKGSYVKNTSLHHLFSRCITIHGTNQLLIQSNVAYDTIGHCYFFEDGAEVKNVLENNLGILTRRPVTADALLPSDITSVAASVFWITNPDNTFVGNVAAGSQGSGFWFSLPMNPTGPSATSTIWPRRTPLGKFEGNVTHSNTTSGLWIDNGPKPDLTVATESTSYVPIANPIDPKSKSLTAKFDKTFAYKNRQRGIWLRGVNLEASDSVFADNWMGIMSPSGNAVTVRDSLFVGESSNKGTPMSASERLGLDGRTLFNPGSPSQRMFGAGFYDNVTDFNNLTFVNFRTNAQRKAGAMGNNEFTSFNMSTKHVVSGAKFINSDSISLEKRSMPLPSAVPNHQAGGEDGYRSAVIHDKDGSVTGKADQYIVPDNPFLLTPACSFTASWNAWVCPKPYAKIQVVQNSLEDISPITIKRDDGELYGSWGTPASTTIPFRKFFYINLIPDRQYEISSLKPLGKIRVTLLETEPDRFLTFSVKYPSAVPLIYKDNFSTAVFSRTDSIDKLDGNNYFYSDADGLLTIKLLIKPGQTSAFVDINPSQPLITSIAPINGPVGTSVTVTGSGFTATGNKIRFGNLGTESDASYVFDSSDKKTITFTVPARNYPVCAAGTTCPSPTPIQPGNYSVSVINNYGTSNSMTFNLPSSASSPDTMAPTVSISSPVANAVVSGNQSISASATDNIGVTKVEFYIGGVLKSTDNTSPYTYLWDTTNGGTHGCTGPHTHTLSAKAYDAAGNVGSSSNIVVNMNNPPHCTTSSLLKRVIASPPNQTDTTLKIASAFKADAVYIAFRTPLTADINEPNVANTKTIKDAGYNVVWGLDFGVDPVKTFDRDRAKRWFDVAKTAGVSHIEVIMIPAWDYVTLTDLLSWMNTEIKSRGMKLAYYYGDNITSSTDGADCLKLMNDGAITHAWVLGGWSKAKRPGCDKAQGNNFWAQMIVWAGGFDSTGRRFYTDARGIKSSYEWIVGGTQYKDAKGSQMGVGVPTTLFLWGWMNASGFPPKQSQLDALTELANMHDSDLAGRIRTRDASPYPTPEKSPTDQGPGWDVL